MVCAIPLLVRRGGRDIKKMLRSLLNGADGVVAHKSGVGMRFEMACERPPRLRGIRWLRAFLLTAQPPLLTRRGICHRNYRTLAHLEWDLSEPHSSRIKNGISQSRRNRCGRRFTGAQRRKSGPVDEGDFH